MLNEKKNYGMQIMAFFLIYIYIAWLVMLPVEAFRIAILTFFSSMVFFAYFDDFMNRLDIWMRMKELR